jgi:hypothetical protein
MNHAKKRATLAVAAIWLVSTAESGLSMAIRDVTFGPVVQSSIFLAAAWFFVLAAMENSNEG